MQRLRSGLVVLTSTLGIVAADMEATQILLFPNGTDKLKNPSAVQEKVRSWLLQPGSGNPPKFVPEFRSGKRSYRCYPFYFEMPAEKNSHPAVALLLERRAGPVSMRGVADHYALTAREMETVELLLQGLTSKEIADRMKISPNTVKAFLRLVMVKMGACTRAGVIGRIVSTDLSNPTVSANPKRLDRSA